VSAALKNAAAEKERADGNAAQSKANAAEAEKQRQIAMANAKEEERQRQIAVGEGAKADASAKIAEANAKEAKDKAREAVDNAENAEANAKIAEASAKEAKDARQAAVDESTRANLLLAQALVQYAGRLVHDGRKEEAMASMSRALQVDKASMDAKSWIFDLLLHGGFRASAATPGEPFIHAPWDLQKRVLSVVYSPDADGRFIAAGSWDHAQIWEAKTATRADGPLIPPGPVTSHPGTDIVNSVAFSKDGRLGTASADNMIRIWDVATRRLIKSLDDKAPAVSATFSPDGLQVLTASLKDHGVTLWNVSDGSGLQFPLSAPAGFAAFCPNGRDKLVVTASWDKPAQVWDVSGKLLASFGPSGKVRSAQFSPDCTYIVTALGDSTAQVWEWNKERPVGAALLHTGAVNSAAFSQDPHGLRVVTASDDKTARVWDASTGTPIGAPLVHGDRVMSAAFSPDGKRVVTACYDGKVRVWDVWFDFDDTKLLADLAESLSGYKSAELPDRLVKLSDQEKQDLLNALREAAVHPPAGAASTAFFLRWFFSISN
jgi:WD40 repeat protein